MKYTKLDLMLPATVKQVKDNLNLTIRSSGDNKSIYGCFVKKVVNAKKTAKLKILSMVKKRGTAKDENGHLRKKHEVTFDQSRHVKKRARRDNVDGVTVASATTATATARNIVQNNSLLLENRVREEYTRKVQAHFDAGNDQSIGSVAQFKHLMAGGEMVNNNYMWCFLSHICEFDVNYIVLTSYLFIEKTGNPGRRWYYG